MLENLTQIFNILPKFALIIFKISTQIFDNSTKSGTYNVRDFDPHFGISTKIQEILIKMFKITNMPGNYDIFFVMMH